MLLLQITSLSISIDLYIFSDYDSIHLSIYLGLGQFPFGDFTNSVVGSVLLWSMIIIAV